MDIQAIRGKLQKMEAMVAAQGRQSDQSATHSGMVMDTLTGNLGETALQFTKILELRTEVCVVNFTFRSYLTYLCSHWNLLDD
jgi:hypothetical protein